jgi:hypothetical protein
MNPMTAPDQCSQFFTSCTANELEDCFHITGSFDIRVSLASSPDELDEIIALADHVGQLVKQNVATTTLERADQRAAALAQEIAPHLHKHGKRPFTLITPYGRLKMKRQRLRDTQTGKTLIPSAKLWKTAQNRHIVTALAELACETSQNISYRKSKEKISQEARVDSLLAHSTVWNLKQDEEQRLEKAQQQFVESVLKEQSEILTKHGFLPSPKESVCEEIIEDAASEEIEEDADALYTYFTAEYRKNKSENETCSETTDDDKAKRVPRHVPVDTILLQADEVLTKSQEPNCKVNKTFTATLESPWGRCEYLASRSSESLQTLVAVILVLWGLLAGKKLEVISDGAAWIRLWIGRLVGVEVYHILCWYHLCKRVCDGLSGVGAAKEERKLLQRTILGFLWKGNVDDAVEALKALLPRCRVRSRVEELIDYLLRKRSWVADYESRQSSGLWIASTRVEKWNDVAVSERCKHRGMSWTKSGVLAMALHAAEVKRSKTQHKKNNAKIHTTP